ncbi:MAG: hypothetical protein NZ473_07240 [Candidatus Kapabacteria bacterium]|nr:hypothetical protein [Candidatus Kapabacteria bacterium]MDW8225385.1 hypothetical protein [Bacteroidota bacterium]
MSERGLRKEWALVVGIVAGGWSFILAFGQSQNFLYADDALPFVVRIHQGQTHPHHLVIGGLGCINRALEWTRPQDFLHSLGLARVFVVVMSVIAVAAVGYIAWSWFRSLWSVLAAMLLLMASYGFWAYSVVPDFYVPGIAAIMVAMIGIERFQDTGKAGWLGMTAGATWLATMCHQSYGIFALIVGAVLFSKRAKYAVGFIVVSSLLVAISYLLAFRMQQEYQAFGDFVLGYVPHMQFTPYDELQWMTPVYAAVGMLRAWTFPEYFVRLDSCWEWVLQSWEMKLLLDERFLLRGLPSGLALVLGAVGVLSVGALFFIAIRKGPLLHRYLRGRWSYWVLLGWAAALGILAFLWEPSSNEFWLWMPPVIGVALSGLSAAKPAGTLWVSMGGLMLTTAPIIWLYRSPDSDIYSVNKRYRTQLQPSDVLITGDFQQTIALNWLYPTPARVLQYEVGRLVWGDSALQRALGELARLGSKGRLVLDPMIVMPHRSEIALRRKLPGWEEKHAQETLERISEFCQGSEDERREQHREVSREHGRKRDEKIRRTRARGNHAPVAHQLQSRRRIPLVGVWRDGGGVVEFEQRSLPGLEWIR